MASNGANSIEDPDVRHETDCDDGEKVVTMMDVLQEQQDFEDDANAVLGASDEKNCTYTKGYIKRQAIYACMTCCSEARNDPSKRAGVCLACSLNCHENHELIELYTKRNFRCDCGNPKFNSHPCTFIPDKSNLNDDNTYNQNFSGLYCNCHRPYPDPESTVEDEEMIQCIICEDWLHASHLDAVVPGNDQYSEMVCKACMENNEFLHDYSYLAVNIETGHVDVISDNGIETKLNNGDLETDKWVNGTGDTIQDPKMDVDNKSTENKEVEKPVEVNENKSVTDETSEYNEIEKTTEIFKSDITKEDETIAEKSQLSLVVDSKDDPDTVITSEESNENTANDTSEVHGSFDNETDKPEESKETLSENGDTSKNITETTEESETPDEPKETTKLDLPESNINTDLIETETKQDSTEPETNKDLTEQTSKEDLDLPESEKTGETSTCIDNDHNKQTEITSEIKTDTTIESGLTDETDKLGSEDINDSKIEDTCEDTQTNNEGIKNGQNNMDIEINETNEESSSGKTNSAENGIKTDNEPSNENMETEIGSRVESSETLKDEKISDKPCVDRTEALTETIDTTEDTKSHKENKRKLSTDEPLDNNVKKPKIDEESKCIRPKCVKRVHKGATFWPSNFRQKLCSCGVCLSMYKDLSVLFLLDPEDTVIAYETLGKERIDGRATQYEKGLEALSSLDRVQQINALTEYNIMKDKLLDFLKSFKDRKEIVKEEDIKAFFAGMKPKREPDGVYFCR